MSSKQGSLNINIAETAKRLKNATCGFEKVWERIVGYPLCNSCLNLYLHQSNIAHKAPNLIKLMHDSMSYNHLMNLEELKNEITEIVNEAHCRTSDFFKCNHLRTNSQAQTPTKGCNCMKALCMKYCKCSQAGLSCTQNCCCIGCKNPHREIKGTKQISFKPEKKDSKNNSPPNLLENMSKLLLSSLRSPKFSELITKISPAPQPLNRLSSLLNKESKRNIVPPFSLFGGQTELQAQFSMLTSNSHNILPNKTQNSLNSMILQTLQTKESNHHARDSIKARISMGQILTPKARYSEEKGSRRRETWLEVSSDEENTCEGALNENSSNTKPRTKIDYVSLLKNFREKRDLSILDKFVESRNVCKTSDVKVKPAPRIMSRKKIKNYDAPLKIRNQELSSAESESILEPSAPNP
ncbi:unnamed protein product [Moneuplotes crassus]|uniref:CRC domain-containing protein n=1 Tax=Euplotes crassus TaxID=5936 RepID=A0AAD1XG03_EUPCR|nr:unnamed protein product [Moneuplotes crassus]